MGELIQRKTYRDPDELNKYIRSRIIFNEARRYDVKGRKYFQYPNKYYCVDIGLRNARLNFRQQ